MTEFIQGVALVVLYRSITVIVGFVIVYLGFVLFRIGVYEKAGELKAAWGENKLTLKQAAPGTFFALFGAGVISVSIWQGIDLEKVSTTQKKSADVTGNLASIDLGAESGLPPLVPEEVQQVIDKIKNGEELTQSEGILLAGWISQLQQTQEKIRYYAIHQGIDGPGGLS